MPSSSRLYRRILPFIALGIAILLTGARSLGPQSPYSDIVVGAILGTLFGHTTVIAVWTTLGLTPLRFRLGVAALWLSLLVASLFYGAKGGRDASMLFALGLGAQWLLAQIPLWPLVWVCRLRLESEVREHVLAAKPQFGLRQLMIFTAAIAVVLGLGRLIVTGQFVSFPSHELPAILFLSVAAVLVSLPPALAALLPRRALLSVLALVSFSALMTLWELPVLGMFTALRGPDSLHIALINVFTCGGH